MPGKGQDTLHSKAGPLLFGMTLLLTLGALSISGYLAYMSLVAGLSPAGCGSGSGCAQVLASKWSRCLGVPVSVLASWMYVSVFAALILTRSRSRGLRRAGGFVLTGAAASIVTAAGWFIYLQIVKLGALCPYCMTGHALGLALAGLLLWQAPRRSLIAVCIGLASVVGVILIQINTATVVGMIDTLAGAADTDLASEGKRTLTLLGGELTLTLQDEPLLGNADAPKILAVMFDYACPHCRHTHGVLDQVRRDEGGNLAIVAMPTPLNRACNPHAPELMPTRFDESCELARIALAVFLADPAEFEAFDRWMFEPDMPRTAEQARAKAIRRVGQRNFEHAFADPRMKQKLARNVLAYGRSGADRVPVLIAAGAPVVYGRVDDPDTVTRMLIPEDGPSDESQ